ncbi:MAG: hypothetical protein ACRC8A_17800 [Microcoleaceae cyanobacterium]
MAAKISLLALAVFASLGTPSFAQSNNEVDPLEGFDTYEQDSRTNDGIDSRTMFDLIHRMQTGGFNIDYDAAQSQQQQSIKDAAAEFRTKQRERLQQQQGGAAPVQSVEGPPVEGPQ